MTNIISTITIPEDIKALLGKRPLIFGEKPDVYDALLSRVAAAVDPQDTIEWLYLKDVVDITWEIQRLRRFQTSIINNKRRDALGNIIAAVLDVGENATKVMVDRKNLADKFIAGDEETKKLVEPQMKKYDLDDDSVMAEAFDRKLESIEAIDQMLTRAEVRRDRMLEQIACHREAFAQRMRKVADTEGKVPNPQALIAHKSAESQQPTANTSNSS
jgi:dsDNA-binding SOS-regulon protein